MRTMWSPALTWIAFAWIMMERLVTGASLIHGVDSVLQLLPLMAASHRDPRCTYLKVDPTSRLPETEQENLEARAQVTLSSQKLEDDAVQRAMKLGTDCVIGVAMHGRGNNGSRVAERMIGFLRVFGNRLAIVDTGRRAEEDDRELMRESYLPVFSVRQVGGRQQGGNLLVFLSCPKVQRDLLPSSRPVMHHRSDVTGGGGGGATLLFFHEGQSSCPNPMQGQYLSFTFVPTVPWAIMPRTPSGQLSGFTIAIFKFLAWKFDFRLGLTFMGSFKTREELLKERKGPLPFAAHGSLTTPKPNFDETYPFHLAEMFFMSRRPQPVDDYSQIARPFTAVVWVSLSATVCVLAAMMMISFRVYVSLGERCRHFVARRETHAFNFFLFPLTKLTEPDPLPWFAHKPSAGRAFVALWVLAQFWFIMFYCVNLRAHLIAQRHESPIVTLQDVLDNGKRTWMFTSHLRTTVAEMQKGGLTSGVAYQVALLANRTGGYYDPYFHRGIPKEVGPDMADNRAVLMLLGKDTALYSYFFSRKYFTRDKIFISKEYMDTVYSTVNVPKHTPALPYLNDALMRAHAAGLFLKFMTDPLPIYQLIDKFDSAATEDGGEDLGPIDMKNILVAFFFFLCGIAVAAAAFGCEVCRKKMLGWGR